MSLRTAHPGRLLAAVMALALAAVVVISVGFGSSPSRATDYHPEYGTVVGADAVLLRGCHDYVYSYAMTPPAGQWLYEITISDSTGRAVGSTVLLEGADALSGQKLFQLCHPTIQPGVYTINTKMTVDPEGSPNHVEGFLPPATFTLSPQPKQNHRKINGLGPIRVR